VRVVIKTDASDLCNWGWDPEGRHYGGCVCSKPLGHKGRCKCDSCLSSMQRPSDWDAKGRKEASR